jgi:hypothetical protein
VVAVKVLRTDIGALRPAKKTPQGFLKLDGYASRVGVFEYPDGKGGVRRELRPESEVFHADVMAAFEGAPVTDGHPSTPTGKVTADNAKALAVGSVLAPAQREDQLVRASMIVTDAATIAKVQHGKTALSVGYDVDLDLSPGVDPIHGRYDAIQRGLVINHLALVDCGRAGPEARVRLDSGSDVIGLRADSPTQGVTMAVTEETLAQLGIQTKRAEEAEKQLATEKARADRAEAANETLRLDAAAGVDGISELPQLRADALKLTEENTALKAELATQKAGEAARLEAGVGERVRLQTAATRVLGLGNVRFDEVPYTEEGNRKIMSLVIEKVAHVGGKIPDGATIDWIRGRFDSCVERYDNGARGQETMRRAAVVTPRQDAAPIDMRTPREKFDEDMMTRGTRPLGKGA